MPGSPKSKDTLPPKVGDLRLWHIPQVPGPAFRVPVKDVKEAKKLYRVLADYDLFQFENNIKGDYSNVTGLEVYDGEPESAENDGWSEWHNDEDKDLAELVREEDVA